MNDFYCSYTKEIVCPYCGYEFTDSWEIDSNNQDIGEIECQQCGETFIAHRNIEITYNTTEKEEVI